MRKTIVIIGHDITNDMIAARYLSHYYRVVVMPSVGGMRDDVRKADPCAVVLHADPYDARQAQELLTLRDAVGPRVPIIVTVPAATGPVVQAALQADVLACLPRPVNPAELEQLLRQATCSSDAVGTVSSWGVIASYGRHARQEQLRNSVANCACPAVIEAHR